MGIHPRKGKEGSKSLKGQAVAFSQEPRLASGISSVPHKQK